MTRPLKLIRHTLDGQTRIHVPGCNFTDYQTACGSSWDDGRFEEIEGQLYLVDCHGCLATLDDLELYVMARRAQRTVD